MRQGTEQKGFHLPRLSQHLCSARALKYCPLPSRSPGAAGGQSLAGSVLCEGRGVRSTGDAVVRRRGGGHTNNRKGTAATARAVRGGGVAVSPPRGALPAAARPAPPPPLPLGAAPSPAQPSRRSRSAAIAMSFLFGSRSSKTFKPKKNIPEGSHQYELLKHAEATLGSGNLRMAVMLPEGEDLNEWVAVNTPK
nr:MOB kinase activator 1B isoform X3 [Anser cygnoides]